MKFIVNVPDGMIHHDDHDYTDPTDMVRLLRSHVAHMGHITITPVQDVGAGSTAEHHGKPRRGD
jgi:hypothetical protein